MEKWWLDQLARSSVDLLFVGTDEALSGRYERKAQTHSTTMSD